MRALIQRVGWCRVQVDGRDVNTTGPGMLVLLGIAGPDGEEDVRYLARKTADLRIFEGDDGKMNLSLKDTAGDVMVVPQFTLVADTGKGNRPGFGGAALPENAEPLYELFVREIKDQGIRVKTGIFGADMAVSLLNDGPVTILLESKKQPEN